MEREIISYATLKKVLSPKELKNILGGTGATGSNKYRFFKSFFIIFLQ